MTLNLDLVAAGFMGLIAMCAFTLDIMSSPNASRWVSLPAPIRWIVRATATMSMLRSVDLFSLSERPGPIVGQVNWLTAIWSGSLTLTVVALTLYALNNKMPAKAWDRIRYAVRTMKERPDTVPIMMSEADVLTGLRASGQPVASGNNPSEVAKEAPRYLHAIAHSRRHRRG